MDKQVILWTTGGFTAGCIISSLACKLLSSEPGLSYEDAISVVKRHNREYMLTCSSTNVITGFSNMTCLLGSPTASGMVENEFLIYNPKLNYPRLDSNRNIMARYLTQELYEELYDRKTSACFTIDACIQTGLDNPEKVNCGIVAGDEECYDMFVELFDPVIKDRHHGFRKGIHQHTRILSHDGVSVLPFDPKYVKSLHFLVGRCIRGYRFPPSCSRAERKQTETLLKTVLESMTGEYSGTYVHLNNLTDEQRNGLPDVLQGISDKPNSTRLQSSCSTRDWPDGRGIFHNKEKTFFAWTNREDHLRIMYRDRNYDIAKAFKKFCVGMKIFKDLLAENGLEFAFHKDYGYLLTCPSGIGTALRAGIHIKLPLLLHDSRFRKILKALRLHMGSEHQDLLNKGYIDVYNQDRLGFDENYLVQHVAQSVHLLIQMEKRLENNETITDLIPNIDDDTDD